MPVEQSRDDASWDPESAMAQLYVAFGQGAVSVHVAPAVLSKARAEYLDMVKKNSGRWDAIAGPMREYARALGRIAAHLAVGDGLDVILVKHYDAASKALIDNSHLTVCGPCPGCIDPHRR